MQLAQLIPTDRRQKQRRHGAPCRTISNHAAFEREERMVFKTLERRKERRRDQDVRRVVAMAV